MSYTKWYVKSYIDYSMLNLLYQIIKMIYLFLMKILKLMINDI